MSSAYDIIGDVHGCAETLKRLLIKLGYKDTRGVFEHTSRKAIFVGDLIDRGPRIRETLQVVRPMVESGTAICLLGNHEVNALAYTTPLKDSKGFVRPHTKRHNRQIFETLEQFAAYPEEWRGYLDWFLTLPLFFENEDFRAVHACWDDALISEYKCRYGSAHIDKDIVYTLVDEDSFEFKFIDRITRGIDMPLPKNRSIQGIDGTERKLFRTKFWADEPVCYQDVVFQPDPLPEDLCDKVLSEEEKKQLLYYSRKEKPVFVGHYWLQGRPKPIRKNIACLDYSAVKYGRLCAYRYDGEEKLSEDKFCWVYVNRDND